MLGEHALARRRGLPGYRLEDALASLGCGIAQQVSLVFVTGALVGVYEELYRHARLVTFAADSPWPWVIGFVAGDLVFYWWHRASHEVTDAAGPYRSSSPASRRWPPPRRPCSPGPDRRPRARS